jgi:N-acetylglucosaminyldiphosphoundecaprenol N-acetyl-beta-D-mannosaminyltransferase
MNNSQNKVDILGVQVNCTQRDRFLQIPIKWAQAPVQRTIMYVNAHCLNLATNDPDYRAILNSVDLVYADGFSVVLGAKLLYGSQLEKSTGRAWIHDFCSLAQRNDVRLYILAGEPGIAQTAKNKLQNQFSNIQIVGTHHGYLSEVNNHQLISDINQAEPQILFVGMGTPRQEKWLATHRDQIQAPVCWAVGALFDYVAGVETGVPRWLDRLNLEWLWRLLLNPLGKWKRYLIGNPVFLFRILRQKLHLCGFLKLL